MLETAPSIGEVFAGETERVEKRVNGAQDPHNLFPTEKQWGTIVSMKWNTHLAGFEECLMFHLKLWQCPPTLFIAMGFFTIISMVATYMLATRYAEEPEIAALVVIFVAFLSLVVGTLIVNSFKKIAEAHRMKSEFVSIVSHQLRSPLSIFKWTLEMMEREIQPKLPNDSGDFVGTLKTSTEAMIRLVNSLLDINRIETNSFALPREPINLDELVRQTIVSLAAYARASNVTFETDIGENLPPAQGNRDRILMVLHHLLDNAIRYTAGGGMVRVSLKHEGRKMRLSVRDRGIGIPVADQRQVFQKFFRARHSLKFQTEGTGIGLYLSKAIIEHLGGAIGFRSQEGGGSEFWFTIPIANLGTSTDLSHLG